ncbi:MAG: hypothetical protein KKG93_11050 [Bacteroidetes bacterium]|nr:hypothetical protein [Bacteroidota bacterium]
MAKNNYENYTHAQLIAELKKLSKRMKYGLVWEEEKTKEINSFFIAIIAKKLIAPSHKLAVILKTEFNEN